MTRGQLRYEKRRAKKQGVTLRQREKLKKLKKDIIDHLKRPPRHWSHTAEAFRAWRTSKSPRSILEMCTGSGKTEVLACIIFYVLFQKMIMQNKKKPPFSLAGVMSPKIVLNMQLQTAVFEVFSEMRNKGYDTSEISTILIHSGGENKTDDYQRMKMEHLKHYQGKSMRDYDATTNREEIQKAIKDCQDKNRPILCFGTYHSAPTLKRVVDGMNLGLDILGADEAHRLVSEVFSKITDPAEDDFEDDSEQESIRYTEEELNAVCTLRIERAVFATATPLYTDSNDSIGMNNTTRFGETVFRYPAHQGVKDGVIAKPMAGWLKICGLMTSIDSPRVMKELVSASFEEFEKLNKKFNNDLATKMVIRCRNSEELRWMRDSTKELREQGITVAVVGSRVGNHINGVEMTRSEWLSEIKKLGLDRSVKLIVAHINIVTEGVDVPGLNSFLATCLMGYLMMIQNIGRILRWSEGKEVAFVGVPRYTYNSDNAAKWRELMNHYKNEYGDSWQAWLTIGEWQEDGGDEEPRDELQVSKGKKRTKKDELTQFVDDVHWEEFLDKELQDRDQLTKARSILARMGM